MTAQNRPAFPPPAAPQPAPIPPQVSHPTPTSVSPTQPTAHPQHVGQTWHAPPSGSGRPASGRIGRPIGLIAAIALVVVLAAGGWLLFGRGGEGSKSSATTDLERLPSDPKELYSFTLGADEEMAQLLTGSPELLVARIYVDDDQWYDDMRVYDGQGDELWRQPIRWNAEFQVVGNDVLLASEGDNEDAPQRLVRLSGATGDELWSIDVARSDDTPLPQLFTVYETSVVVWDHPSKSSVAYDLMTGDKIATLKSSGSVPEGSPPLRMVDHLMFVEDGKIVVVDERFERLGSGFSWEEMGRPTAWAYMDGEILAVNGQTLTRFSTDGVELASADFDVEGIEEIDGAADSIWFYETPETCGVLRFTGTTLEPLWEQSSDCLALVTSTTITYAGGDPLLFGQYQGGPAINALTGEVVAGSEDEPAYGFANGYSIYSQGSIIAYSWPGNEELFSFKIGERRWASWIDGGYLINDRSGDREIITVYG